MSRTKVAVCNP